MSENKLVEFDDAYFDAVCNKLYKLELKYRTEGNLKKLNKIDAIKKVITQVPLALNKQHWQRLFIKVFNALEKDNNDIEAIVAEYIPQDSIVTPQDIITTFKFINSLSYLKADKIKKYYFCDNIWKVFYDVKPPSPVEFLTADYIGPIADELYPHIKETFCTFLNPLGHKRVLVLSACLSYGKSTLSALISLYTIMHLCYLKNPKSFFGLSQAGSLAVSFLSFTKEKTEQILVQLLSNILSASPIFTQVFTQARLEKIQNKKNRDKRLIHYCTASRMGPFQFAKDIHITNQSRQMGLLGLNVVQGIASEISFWIKRGISIDEIWSTWNDLRNRIESRFYGKYLSGLVLDSSPYDIGLSPIDKYIYSGEAAKDPKVMVVTSTFWDIFPWKLPAWSKTGETFQVYRGTASRPPKILNEHEIKNYNTIDIIDVPIDLYQSFRDNLKKQLCDYASYPSGSVDKLFDDPDIIENIFSPQLENIYGYISAPSNRNPENLIWNQIRDDFFIDVKSNFYVFYRASNAFRTLHIDTAESKDMASLAMSHMEIDNTTGQKIVVCDLCIPISPEKCRISIDALGDFVIDLKKIGHIKFHRVSADGYQSSAILQRIERHGIPTAKLSVDKDPGPYYIFLSWIQNERFKIGRNILLKNNLSSLIEKKTGKGSSIIDHTSGKIVYEDGGDWENSAMGIHMKDVSDSVCGSAYTVITELNDKIPRYQWDEKEFEEDNDNVQGKKIEDNNKIEINQSILDEINKKFGLTF